MNNEKSSTADIIALYGNLEDYMEEQRRCGLIQFELSERENSYQRSIDPISIETSPKQAESILRPKPRFRFGFGR